MIDARIGVIEERLKNVKRIIAVSSGKGGVGKSMVSAAIALALAKKYKVGLLDLDFYGPSTHLILNANEKPVEKNGILPPIIDKIKFMSIIYFTEENPAPLKGKDIINAIIELLAITIWDELDFLIIDMPPGMGEEVMAIIKFMKNAEFIVVTTPSILSWETVKKLLIFLKENKCNVVGVIENMVIEKSIENEIKKTSNYLGKIGFDENVENCIGEPSKLLESKFGKDVEKIAMKI
ncbi:MAG: ATP-binding protein [Thermoplasmata archaeon]|nr:MAG: ATP-binding protein [Thermoplasmata archaeon]